MVLRALQPFLDHPDVAKIALVLPADSAKHPPPWLARLAGRTLAIVPGGAERRDSVATGLGVLPPQCTTVLVHDGARPFVAAKTIDRVIAVARAGSGAVPAIPLSDTVKQTEPGGDGTRIAHTLARDRLWRAQTPQGFPRSVLERAYARRDPASSPATDDAVLVEALGEPVCVVLGSPFNLKVTTPEDFALAELWASRGG